MKIKRSPIYLIIWLSLISYALLTPSDSLPDLMLFPHMDKVIHLGMFLGLAFLIVPVIVKNNNYRKAYLIAFSVSTVAGILFEILQLTISVGRSGSILDTIADTIGAIIGILLYQLIVRNKKIEQVIF